MAIGKEIETRGHITGFQEEIAKAANSSENDFFTWFADAKDKDAAFIRGNWDFSIHIVQACARFLSNPEEKVALEIGHGGGRVIAAASRYFKQVIGIDVHENNSRVEDELKNRGVRNLRLEKTNGREIPLGDATVDFIYSFVVLQHVEKMGIFEKYLQESSRVLKKDGIAVLYFGRRCSFSVNKTSRLLYLLDRMAEIVFLPNGYRELPARVNETNLIVSLPKAKRLARNAGFEILGDLVSRKIVPDGVRLYGGQNGLILRKGS